MPRLKDILQHQRKKNFVGRQREMLLFQEMLAQKSSNLQLPTSNPEPEIYLLYIHGSGGQGKTSLLKQFADHCKESSVPFIQLDCRYIESHPASFKQAFETASPFTTEAIEAHDGVVVLLIDTYEKLKPLDDWMRMEFLPELPGNVITVIAGRSHLATNWKTDVGWQSISKEIALKELTEKESTQLLYRRNIPGNQVQRIVHYTHGNPLALSIVADMFGQKHDSHFDPLDSPDIMKALLEQFVQEVPSPAHKAALELCSLVYVTTEKLIEEVLGPQLAQELFNWLTTLTFIEKGHAGIYPHDLARDAIAAEMHWRNPEWYRHLHIKTQQFYIARLLRQQGEKQREVLFGLIFLHRMNPAVKPFFEFQETGSSWQDKMNADDRQQLTEIVHKYEGKAAAANFSNWLDHSAAEVWVFRDAEKIPAGFVLKINVEQLTAPTHDKVINNLLLYKKEWKIEEGQLLTAFRSWMSRDHYQNVSGVQSAIFLSIVQWYFTPNLAISMLNCVNPDFWRQILNYADLHHLPVLDHEANEQNFGWYMHDWRQRPPLSWLELMGKREINEDEMPTLQDSRLTEEKFIDSVHEALKQLNNPKKIVGNALLKCDFIKDETGSDIDHVLTLTDKLVKAVASLENSPRDEQLHRVLYRTFINPVGGQEQTADFLYMSFSTYRRQVRKGVERIADMLWLEEKKTQQKHAGLAGLNNF